MKTALLAAALIIGGLSQSHATQPGDLACSIHDVTGNALTYTFGPNSTNANGSLGGTFVETGFDKNVFDVIKTVLRADR